MPSVVTTWDGSCAMREARELLIEYLTRLAERSHRLFHEPPTAIIHDGTITGRIMIDADLIPDGAALERVGLHGIELHLFDPRKLYDDLVSIVFASADEYPLLNGRLVDVQREDVSRTEWRLARPSLHLRYYLEAWSDDLFWWIREFFVPNLAHRRYAELSDCGDLRRRLERAPSRAAARSAIFDELLDRFDREADAWKHNRWDEIDAYCKAAGTNPHTLVATGKVGPHRPRNPKRPLSLELLRTSIFDLGLPPRVMRALEQARISTVAEVMRMRAEEILKLGLGTKGLYDLRRRLDDLGLRLRGDGD